MLYFLSVTDSLTLRCMGNYSEYLSNHHQILTQVTVPFVYSTYKMREIESKLAKCKPKCVLFMKLVTGSRKERQRLEDESALNGIVGL